MKVSCSLLPPASLSTCCYAMQLPETTRSIVTSPAVGVQDLMEVLLQLSMDICCLPLQQLLKCWHMQTVVWGRNGMTEGR